MAFLFLACPCFPLLLSQVAVAILRRIHVHSGEDDSQAAERFAQALHGKWGVGRAACQNGVLLLVAMENR